MWNTVYSMKKMNLLPSFLLLLTPLVARGNLIDEVPSKQVRRRAAKSNDGIDLRSFQKYNCDGLFLDWSGPSPTAATSERVVEYDYDVFVKNDADLTTSLASIQNRLLRYVGDNVLAVCHRRLEAGDKILSQRQLDGLSITEVTTAPGDVPYPPGTKVCSMEAEFPYETICYPVLGSLTVYYTPSGDSASDDAMIDETVKNVVKRGMDNSVLVTDSTPAVYYIGDRNTFSFNSAYLEDSESSSSWLQESVGMVIGTIMGIIAFFFILICYKKRGTFKRKNGESGTKDKEPHEEADKQENESAKESDDVAKSSNSPNASTEQSNEYMDDTTVKYQGKGWCIGGYC